MIQKVPNAGDWASLSEFVTQSSFTSILAVAFNDRSSGSTSKATSCTRKPASKSLKGRNQHSPYLRPAQVRQTPPKSNVKMELQSEGTPKTQAGAIAGEEGEMAGNERRQHLCRLT
jgi:hypothetical protein